MRSDEAEDFSVGGLAGDELLVPFFVGPWKPSWLAGRAWAWGEGRCLVIVFFFLL